MIPFARVLNYGNIAPKEFLGISTLVTFDSTGYNPAGRNNTSSCSPNVAGFPYIYFYGGITGTSTYLNDFFYYNTEDNKFYQIPSGTLTALRGAALTYTPDGYIYGFGGGASTNIASTQFFRHKVGTSTIELITNDTGRPEGRYNHAGICIGNEIYYFGGQSDPVRAIIVAYNYVTRTWRTVKSGITTPLLTISPTSTIMFEGLVYMIIGTDLYTFDPVTNNFTLGPVFSPRSTSAGFVIVNEKLYYILNTIVTRRNDDGTWTRMVTNPSAASYTWYGYVSGKLEAYTLFGGGPNDRTTIMYKFT